uniref:Uncharacterized AAA domain-containing protein ycf46 n=1 Tax=Crouania attenuata TaxID=42002 RepID=A0A4D6WNZ7_9FLOR|nr:hypothetical protein [Crouania attenuata]
MRVYHKKKIKTLFTCSIEIWDFINGYQNNPNYENKAIKNPLEALEIIEKTQSKTPKIFILKDFHLFVNDISITRKLKNLYYKLQEQTLFVIILSPELQIPLLLQEYIKIVPLPLPNKQEIRYELHRLKHNYPEIQDADVNKLILAYQGFSINKIRISISKFITSQKNIEEAYRIILKDKQNLIRQTNILELHSSTYQLEDIGGLSNLKIWLKKRSCSFSQQAKNYGIPNPKGILLVGIQGTGKSLSAKAIAQEWNIPLLKLDVGKIFASLVGESESRMRKMIEIAEKCSPCILWIDEIDKAMQNDNPKGDSGTSNRILSLFLTWLAEKKHPVFIVATANNIKELPAEMLRKGRFDEIFFLNLPNELERYRIFSIHLKKIRPLTWHRYNIRYLSTLTKNFSGAEIEQTIIDAMHNAFYENREFTTNDISESVSQTIPLAFLDYEEIARLQEWAQQGKVRLA